MDNENEIGKSRKIEKAPEERWKRGGIRWNKQWEKERRKEDEIKKAKKDDRRGGAKKKKHKKDENDEQKKV